MEMKKTFHWRDIRNSKPLQFLLEILKDAPGPMTQMEIQLEAQRREGWVANPPTCIDEIGRNPGYMTSGAVRFPDGKYRYWLLQAPGWVPRWKFIASYDETGKKILSHRLVPMTGHIEQDIRPIVPSPLEDGLICRNPECGRTINPERVKEGFTMTCCDECGIAWRESLRPKEEEKQGSLL